MEKIIFNDVENKCFCINTFYPIYLDGEVWSTVTHYFYASKFDDSEVKEKIRLLNEVADIIKFTTGLEISKDSWNGKKEEIMFKSLYSKFTQHPNMMEMLLSTKDAILIADFDNNYWGRGVDGKGQNRLGILIMNVRTKIIQFYGSKSLVLPPWIAFPEIDRYSIFWRMGLGEDYLNQLFQFRKKNDKEKYKLEFPEVDGWEGFYN